MPKSHREYLKWIPSRLIKWAEEIGPNTSLVINTILDSETHIARSHRICLGIMRLTKSYSDNRLENACGRAIAIKSYSYKSIKSILKTGLDQQEVESSTKITTPILHENIRGQEYYTKEDHA